MTSRDLLLGLLVVAGVALVACRDDAPPEAAPAGVTTAPIATPEPRPEPTTAPPQTEPSPTAPPSTAEPTARPVSDLIRDPSDEGRLVTLYWIRGEGLAAGNRRVVSSAPARAAITALLRGPGFLDEQAGMASALPEGVELLGLTINDGTATVDLSPEFEAVSLGTSGELAMVAQIVYTLTQFETVDAVDIWINGEAREAILSHGLEATGLTRAGLADAAAPAIVVERPFPGESVWAPFTVSGFSRTFESTVVWELSSFDGAVLASGFTTARQPDVGVHGPFDFTVEVIAPARGLARLSVFEESAEDGSRINVYDVEVILAGGPASSDATPLPWLRRDGLGPVDFGTDLVGARAAVVDALGTPSETSEIETFCGGPRRQFVVAGTTLWFDELDSFIGWYHTGSGPQLATSTGVRPGTSRDDLEASHEVGVSVDTLGPEFWLRDQEVGGFLTDDGLTVTALYAGGTCFYR